MRISILEVIAKGIMSSDKGYYIDHRSRRKWDGYAWKEAGKALLMVNKEMRAGKRHDRVKVPNWG